MELNILLTGLEVKDYTTQAISTIRQHNPEVDIIWIHAGEEPPGPMGCKVLHAPGASMTEAFNQGILQNPATWHLIINDDVICCGSMNVSNLDEKSLYAPGMGRSDKVGGREFLLGWALLLSDSAWQAGVQYDTNLIKCNWEDFDIHMQAKSMGYGTVPDPTLFPFRHLKASGRVIGSDFWWKNLAYVKEKWNV